MNIQTYTKIRNTLITEVVEELGEERALTYFQLPSNREAIEEIARHKTKLTPTRDLRIENFRKNKKWAHNM